MLPAIVLDDNLMSWTMTDQLIFKAHQRYKAALPHLLIRMSVFHVSTCSLISPTGFKGFAAICVVIVLVCLEIDYTS